MERLAGGRGNRIIKSISGEQGNRYPQPLGPQQWVSQYTKISRLIGYLVQAYEPAYCICLGAVKVLHFQYILGWTLSNQYAIFLLSMFPLSFSDYIECTLYHCFTPSY